MQGKGKQDLHLSRGGDIADPEQNPTWQGKSGQDLYVDYNKGKQDCENPTLQSGSFEHNPSLQGRSTKHLYAS